MTENRRQPLLATEWIFPLGGCNARLFIASTTGNEIAPEDMDALASFARIFKEQLRRRKSESENNDSLA